MSTPDKTLLDAIASVINCAPPEDFAALVTFAEAEAPADDWSAKDILMHEAGKLASKPTNKDGISVFDAVRLALALLLVEASKKDILLEIGHVEPVTNTYH